MSAPNVILTLGGIIKSLGVWHMYIVHVLFEEHIRWLTCVSTITTKIYEMNVKFC